MRRAYRGSEIQSLDNRPPSSRIPEDKLLGTSYYDLLSNAYALHRNNAVASAITETMVAYVAGSGLTPVGASPEAIAVWDNWAGKAGIDGLSTLEDIYRNIVSAQVESGDVLLITPINKSIPDDQVKTRVDLISGARISTPTDFKDGKDKFGNDIRQGVSYRKGREIGYWILKTDKQNIGAKENYDFIRRFDRKTGRMNAFLLRRPDYRRVGATRGLPMTTPVVQQIKDVNELWDAAIWASRNKSNLSVAIGTDRPNDVMSALGAVDNDGATETKEDIFGESQVIGTIPQGSVFTLPREAIPHVISSSGNVDLDALFVRSNRYLCGALGIPSEILYKDYSQTNFSSGKLAIDSFFRKTDIWNRTNSQVFTLLFKMINVEASLRGTGIKNLTKEMLNVSWIGQQNYVDADPDKNSKGEQRRIENNLASPSMILGQRGIKYKELLRAKAEELQAEKEIANEFGIDAQLLRPTPALSNEETITQIEGNNG